VRVRWHALPRSRQLWLTAGLTCLPAPLLIVILAPMFADTRYWTAVYISIALIALIVSMIIWLLGTIRAVEEQRARRVGSPNQTR
jgi:L-asparagine transporter-like permease